MKPSSWLWSAVAALALAGMVFGLAGVFGSGRIGPPELAGGAAKPFLAEARKKMESVRARRQQTAEAASSLLPAGTGHGGGHRVFVSAQLVYLPENPEPVQPLDRAMKTDDGIEVGWKMKYGFDPADPRVRDADPDGDGFTNLEEFAAQPPTDPTRKEDSPAKESKLKSRSGDPLPMTVSFLEKSGGLFTIRFQAGSKRAQFKGAPGTDLWIQAGPEGVEVWTDPALMAAALARAKQAGRNAHVIPLRFVSYQDKVEKIKDEKAGGVEVEVDNSVLVLERKDALKGRHTLVFSTPQRPQGLSWDVGEIRFFTPASGGTELGPFRVGEVFSYEGKEFAVLGRDGGKIQLLNRSESGKGPFWVPPENASPVTPPRP